MNLLSQKSYRGLKRRSLRAESGYMLLVLMFFVTLLTFSMMATLPKVVQQIKRDREEEMIHRGTEYARAIKKYYKRFQHYPNSLQDLENTNNLRFIRRRFKDPLTKSGNWKLLHITDVQQGVSNPNFGVSQASNFNPQAAQGAAAGGLSANGFGVQNQAAQNPAAQNQEDKNDQASQGGSEQNGGDTSGSGNSGGGTSAFSNNGGAGQPGQTYGAGGIVGVASMSKAKTIREFNNKSNYNKWMFIYDPTQDRGMLLKGPYNPQAFQGNNNNNLNGGGQTLPGAGGPQQNGAPGTGVGTPSPQMPPDQNAPPQ